MLHVHAMSVVDLVNRDAILGVLGVPCLVQISFLAANAKDAFMGHAISPSRTQQTASIKTCLKTRAMVQKKQKCGLDFISPDCVSSRDESGRHVYLWHSPPRIIWAVNYIIKRNIQCNIKLRREVSMWCKLTCHTPECKLQTTRVASSHSRMRHLLIVYAQIVLSNTSIPDSMHLA